MPQMARAAMGSTQSATVSGDGSGMPPGSMMSTAFTVTARGGYQLSRVTSLTVAALTDFQQGFGDPTLGVSFNFPLTRGLMGMASFEAAAPLSTISRDNSKITTLIISAGPMYHKYGYSLSLMGFGTYSFYRSDDDPMARPQSGGMDDMPMGKMATPGGSMGSMMNMSGMSGMNSRELMRHGGMVSFGYPIVRNLMGATSASLLASYREDESISWMTDATLLRLSYLWEGFAGSLGFSFMSDMKNDQTITAPTQPFIGFRLQYVFGDHMTLGGAEACSMSQMLR